MKEENRDKKIEKSNITKENELINSSTKLDFFDRLTLKLPKAILIFLIIYALLPIFSPIAFKFGVPQIGQSIQFIYRIFCHQRVERSMFLFAEDSLVRFYSIEELKEIGYLPKEGNALTYGQNWEIYQYPYWGNEQIGYKVAFCIRDQGLYLALAITSLLIYLNYKKNGKIIWLKWYWILLLCFPMIFDGVFQTIVELFGPNLFGEIYNPTFANMYIENIDKRWLSGMLFGIGFGFIVMPNLLDSANYLSGSTSSDNTVPANNKTTSEKI